MSETTEKSTDQVEPFETLYLPVGDLEIDRRVQRQGINMAKVKAMVKKYNTGALGVITVSLRKDRSYVVIDGQHRTEATRIKTSNMGTLKCHVFTGLTLAQEAQMFLDLNHTSKVPVIDSFKVLLNTDSPEGDTAREIQEIVGAYGFQISRVPANGNINAINVVDRIYALSKKLDAEPSLLQATVLVISRSWGNDRHGTQGAIIEGIGRMFAEYGSRIDLDRLEEAMKTYPGGAQSLIAEAIALAALRKGKVSMGVAELLVEAYNKGRRTKTLEAWRARK
jgi:hypothetical protein